MASLETKRQIVRDIIVHYSQFQPSIGEVELEVVIDEENDHYQLLQNGWTGRFRVEGSLIHIDIRNGKVVIQSDGTADSIAGQLVEKGIAREDIVLAYKHPDLRECSEFPAELPA